MRKTQNVIIAILILIIIMLLFTYNPKDDIPPVANIEEESMDVVEEEHLEEENVAEEEVVEEEEEIGDLNAANNLEGRWQTEDAFGELTYMTFLSPIHGELENSKSTVKFEFKVITGDTLRLIDKSGNSRIDENVQLFISESGESNKAYEFLDLNTLIIEGMTWTKVIEE